MSRYLLLLNRVGSCRLISKLHIDIPSARVQARSFASKRSIPEARTRADSMTTESFLTSIGRDAASKVKVADWNEFWSLDGHALKGAGLAVRDRRYILWCMEKFRQGYEPHEFAHPPTPKKKIRSHGPAVQNGKRIRSRRHR